jgi:hypothetical protein
MTEVQQVAKSKERMTLEQALISRGMPSAGTWPCPVCKVEFPAFALVDVSDIHGIEGDVACSTCFLDDVRVVQSVAEAENQPDQDHWGGEDGLFLKAQRNITLEKYAWTLRPDSGLTLDCRKAFGLFMISWQRMTVDAEKPSQFVEPELPDMTYMDRDQAEQHLLSAL